MKKLFSCVAPDKDLMNISSR